MVVGGRRVRTPHPVDKKEGARLSGVHMVKTKSTFLFFFLKNLKNTGEKLV